MGAQRRSEPLTAPVGVERTIGNASDAETSQHPNTVSRRGCACSHTDRKLKYVGRTDANQRCARPSLYKCSRCRGFIVGDCGAAKRSKCGPCSTRKQRCVRLIGRSGAADRVTDRVAFMTITGPGSDVLPWDRSLCTHHPSVPCSGKLGCVVE